MEYSRRQRTFHSISMDGARTPSFDLQIHPNVPISSTLLIPIKKALNSAGFLTFSNGILRPNSLGWGSIHLGFSNTTNPEQNMFTVNYKDFIDNVQIRDTLEPR